MNTLLTVFGIVTFAFILSLGAYWTLVFPVIRQRLVFRIENSLDRFRLMGLEGKIPRGGKLYGEVGGFLEGAFGAASQEDTIFRYIALSPNQVRQNKVKLQALLAEVDDKDHEDVKSLLDSTLQDLFCIYLAQRPFMVGVTAPLIICSYFIRRCKKVLQSMELDAAAQTLAAA